MKLKTFSITVLTLTLLICSNSFCFCNVDITDESIETKLKTHCSSFCDFNKNNTTPVKAPCYDSTAEIKQLFNEQKNCLNTSNIEGLKKIYSDDYISNDGFNKATLFNLYQDTLKNHPDIKYDVLISKLSVEGNYATVKAINKSTATTAEKSNITGDNGLLNIDMETIFYLKKTGAEWKIVAEQTISEKTSLLYGDCKNVGIQLFAPEYICANTEYTATLKMPAKYAKYAMGSIKKELITYPAQETPDIFKGFDSIGLVERIFKSNAKGNNETIAASVAFALPKIDKSTNNIDIQISGLGVLLQRVNVIVPQPQTPQVDQPAATAQK